MFRRFAPLGLLCLVVGAQGCSTPEQEVPPLFNAIDRSLQCEAGKVGWDFSTGGSSLTDSIRNPSLSSELRVIEATYGGNCGVTPGNWTESFATSCNGRSSCTRKARNVGESDPAYGCDKDFRIRYTCGVEPFEYNIHYAPADTPSKDVAISCGDQMTVIEASWGKNCKSTLAGNYTAKLASKCSGVRRCFEDGVSTDRFGSDAYYGCRKDWEVRYFCGNDRTERVSTFDQEAAVDVVCPVREVSPQADPGLNITSATFGANCGQGTNNALASFSRSCSGKASCSRTVLGPDIPTSFLFFCNPDFRATYTCGTESKEYTFTLSSNAATSSVDLRCGEPIKPIQASWGKNCDATLEGNFLERFKKECTDARTCAFPTTSTALFGYDAKPGCLKYWNFTYTCGQNPGNYTATFSQDDKISFACPVAAKAAENASGIRVDQATYGKNCTGAGQTSVDMVSAATAACYGKDVCDYRLNYVGKDPAPNCLKDLDITYHCGEDRTPATAHITGEAQGKTTTLTCAPAVRVLASTYGAKCHMPTGNATALVANQCNGKRGTCPLLLASLGDPAPNCPKDFKVDYSCGADPAIKTIALASETADPIVLTCPTPTTPYTRKECVPTQCKGRERRDSNLACTKDLTLPQVHFFSGVTLWGPSVATGAATTFKEDTVYDLNVALVFPANISVPTNKEVSNATVWAWDEFEPLSGSGAKVPGFRCTLADMALVHPTAGNPVLAGGGLRDDSARDRFLVGRMANTPLPPACFGNNIASWRDAAKRMGMAEVDFRARYRKAGSTKVEVSIDPEGRLLTTREDTRANIDNAFVPNPIGFYYEANKLWVDFLSYYRQTAISTGNRYPQNLYTANFEDSTTIELLATQTQLRNPEVEVYLFDPNTLPTLEIDFSWLKRGDAPGRNPFSPTATPLTNQVQTLAQRNLGATVEITTKALYDARGNYAWVSNADSLTVGRLQGTSLSKGEAGGSTTRILATLPEAVRDRILRIKNGNNGGWMENGTEALREFKLRVCMDIDGKARSDHNDNDNSPFTVTRGATTFSAKFVQGRRCMVSDQVLVVKRVLEQRPFQPARATAATQAGRSIDQGNGAVSTGNDVGSQSSCQRTCTVNNDCGAGSSCDNGGVAGRVGFCTGAVSSNVCTSRDRNTMGSGGAFGGSLLATNNTNKSDESVAGKARASTNTSIETLGFDVYESGDNASEQPVSAASDTKFSIAVNPNWDIIIAVLKGESLAAEISPLKPIFEKQSLVGRQGIGFGLGRDILFFLGPVPLTLEISAGVVATIGLSFELDLKGESTYPCVGSKKCFQRIDTPASFDAANDDCEERGGRLAEIVTSNDLEGVKTAITDGASEHWIGAQLGYTYPAPSCASNPGSCAGGSTTRYRWITSGVAFGEQAGTNSALLNTSSYQSQFGGLLNDLSDLRTQVPKMAGVTLLKSTGKLNSRLLEPATKRKYVCEFDPAAKAKTTQLKVGLVTGVGAGVSAGICVPSKHAGFCLAAGFNFIEAQFTFAYTKTDTRLFNAAGSLLGTRGTDAFDITWEARALTGSITMQVRLVFFSIEWDLLRFGGVKKWGGEGSPDAVLYHHDYPIRRSLP